MHVALAVNRLNDILPLKAGLAGTQLSDVLCDFSKYFEVVSLMAKHFDEFGFFLGLPGRCNDFNGLVHDKGAVVGVYNMLSLLREPVVNVF